MKAYGRYVALGDSFTEGLNDELPDGSFRGWADHLAEILATMNPALLYANRALRGSTLRDVVQDQVPPALDMKPDLVTFCAGGNDVLVGADVAELGGLFDDALRSFRANRIDVLAVAGPDPLPLPLVRHARPVVAAFNERILVSARAYGARVLDLWHITALRDVRAWSADRLHFTPAAHALIALHAAAALGLPVVVPSELPTFSRHMPDTVWVTTHFLPWVARQMLGRSMGGARTPKRPVLTPVR